jgi:hypothetical protein
MGKNNDGSDFIPLEPTPILAFPLKGKGPLPDGIELAICQLLTYLCMGEGTAALPSSWGRWVRIV